MQRVLIIERDVDFINSARTVLEDLGFEVEIALQGGTGVDIIANRRIDVVILGMDNLECPGMDLLQRVKESKPGIPILVTGDNVTKFRMLDELDDRVAGYVERPLDSTAFCAELEKALALRTV